MNNPATESKHTPTNLNDVWLMFTKDGFYPIHPSSQCKPEDHGRLNEHVNRIEDVSGNILWERAALHQSTGGAA